MQTFEMSEAVKRLPDQFFSKLVKNVQQLKSEGHDVINLGQGNPDLPSPDHVVKVMQDAVADPINHKYPPFSGFQYFREAVAKFYKREYNVDIDPDEEVALMFGSKIGLFELSQCLLNENDTALLPDPGYPDYLSGVALTKAKPVFMPLLEENGFLPDYSKISAETLDEAKVMFLNYPNNPTSAMANRAFFDETVALSKKHNIPIIHDFAYGGIGFDGLKQPSFLASEGAKDIGVEVYTLSKTYNMAGWRVAFAVGNRSIIKGINQLQDHLFTSLFGAVQQAGTEAITGDQTFVKELVATYEGRRNALVKGLNDIGWNVEGPKGTFFAWFPVPKGYTSEEFANLLLEKAHVVVAPGNGFGELGEGYVRLALLETEERLQEAARRIGNIGIF